MIYRFEESCIRVQPVFCREKTVYTNKNKRINNRYVFSAVLETKASYSLSVSAVNILFATKMSMKKN